MSLKLSDNIESVKHSTDEIAKIYIGEDLIFEHDKPVWMFKSYRYWRYSLDGLNYSILGERNNGHWAGGCYCNGRFMFAGNSTGNLATYSVKDVQKGIYNRKSIATGNSGSNVGFYGIASNGGKVVACKASNNNKVYYSLDGGQNWNNTGTGSTPARIYNTSIPAIVYIGNNRFFIPISKASNSENRGKYYYWLSTNPGTYYSVTTNSSYEIVYVQRCNNPNKYYYITVNTRTDGGYSYKTYFSSDGINLGEEVAFNSNDYFPRHFVYAYNKYYCIFNNDIYSSTDGKTFSKISSGYNFLDLQKTNGKLTFVAYSGSNAYPGILKSDGTFQYTQCLDENVGGAVKEGSFVCNRFPRL